ncbi:rRNA (guanine-N(2)-)-methyltransferase [Tolumonas auensis DSM 9187]|uniref:Ribosomal RNA large subunit methyltransferase G n=1 Tax=Tolumonas auensis (strain DSM 9187 / NBRC 110442 / TA 4) TaxID=595494 RepID=C4LBJ2_TOLAT|nr:methyltransferase [Tolumonas auensis]ACQ92427.1 rRNA (guanine-N(2)-)-methyltransferase [Tolumonas auensis DSM 9187]
MNLLNLDTSELTLHRYPSTNDPNLQAWDAADEYLLSELTAEQLQTAAAQGAILILNDSFGALACGLANYQPISICDSLLSQEATRRNWQTNELENHPLHLQDMLAPLPAAPSLVIIKVPKTLAMLEYQLLRLRDVVTPDTRIIAAGKVKEIHNSTLALFEQILGTTKTSLARKKARLIYTQVEDRPAIVNPYPTIWPLDNTDYQIANHANVFARASLDIGARFLLENLPRQKRGVMVDLGCGNGVLGLMALEYNPEAELLFLDESYMAVASSQLNVEQNRPQDLARCRFQVGHSLNGIDSNSIDVILCNPPFHQLQTITDDIAWQMFRDAKRCLKRGGELWIVGNRHLDYHIKLKRLFGGTECIASNSKFVILRTINR